MYIYMYVYLYFFLYLPTGWNFKQSMHDYEFYAYLPTNPLIRNLIKVVVSKAQLGLVLVFLPSLRFGLLAPRLCVLSYNLVICGLIRACP